MSSDQSMDLPKPMRTYWARFLSATNRNASTPVYDVFHFDDNENDSDAVAELLMQGRKRATASLLWDYESRDSRPPRAGDLSVVTEWGGAPLCVIETTRVEVRAFEDVGSDFALAEGEGDTSLEHWKASHWSYFSRVCHRCGREPDVRMPVVCEWFDVVF